MLTIGHKNRTITCAIEAHGMIVYLSVFFERLQLINLKLRNYDTIEIDSVEYLYWYIIELLSLYISI